MWLSDTNYTTTTVTWYSYHNHMIYVPLSHDTIIRPSLILYYCIIYSRYYFDNANDNACIVLCMLVQYLVHQLIEILIFLRGNLTMQSHIDHTGRYILQDNCFAQTISNCYTAKINYSAPIARHNDQWRANDWSSYIQVQSLIGSVTQKKMILISSLCV